MRFVRLEFFILSNLLLLGITGFSQALASSPPTDAQDPASERPFRLLERMAHALETTNFEGTFVYQFGDSLSAMRIVHHHRDGISKESLLTLNGPLRTIGRNEHAVACLLNGDQSVLLQLDHSRRRLEDRLGEHPSSAIGLGSTVVSRAPDWRELSEHYRFQMLETTRVAGRTADVVDVAPRDSLRYGYRFSIDHTSSLPLRTVLMDVSGRPIQRLMFTDIRLMQDGDDPSAGTAHSALPANRASHSLASSSGASPSTPVSQEKSINKNFFFSSLPSGFEIIYNNKIILDEAAPLEYFLLSDGLASVSLYVERSEQPGLVGKTQMAAIHAAGKWLQGYQITAIGEVPAVTVSALVDRIEVHPQDERFTQPEQKPESSP